MRMKVCVLAMLVLLPVRTDALDRCKGKIRKSTGVVEVQANNVVGTLLWGEDAAMANQPLVGCSGSSASPRRCKLGASGTQAELTPPPSCTVHMKDDADTCEAYVRGCVPGVRDVSSLESSISQLETGVSEALELPHVTAIPWSGQSEDTTISTTYEKEKVIGLFTKLRPETDVRVTITSTAFANGNGYCDYQLRVDDLNNEGSATLDGATGAGRAVVWDTYSAFSAEAVFSGLSTGVHELSVYLRGTSVLSCFLNVDDFPYVALVEEITPAS